MWILEGKLNHYSVRLSRYPDNIRKTFSRPAADRFLSEDVLRGLLFGYNIRTLIVPDTVVCENALEADFFR
jgi:hypothetical protein